MVKIPSIFVAFLENMNFTLEDAENIFFYSIRNCPCLPLKECSWFQDILKLPGSPTKREFIIFAKERLCNEDRKHLECCDPSDKTPTIEKDEDLISEENDQTDRVNNCVTVGVYFEPDLVLKQRLFFLFS